jgi:HK97 family phage major capsid protein
MRVATRSFTATVDGEVLHFQAGISHVFDDHPVLREHGDAFERAAPEQHRRLAQLAQRSENREEGATFGTGAASNRGNGNPDREEGLRTIERYQQSGQLRSEAADRLDNIVRHKDPTGIDARYLAAVGDPDYASAFGKILADPMHGHLRHTPEEVAAMQTVVKVENERGLVGGTGSAGGFALPITIDPSVLLSSAGELNPVRQIARVEIISTREWRGVSSDGVTASYDAEASEVSDDTPVLAQPTAITASGRAFVPFSHEIGDDWSSLQEELAKLVTDARDVLDSAKMLTGSGTDEPAGLLTGLSTAQRVLTATTATLAIGDSYLIKAALPARFVPGASFCANPVTLDAMYRQAGGGSTEPQVLPDRGGQWLGKPTYEWTSIVATTTTGSKIGVYGDFKHYLVADRLGMTAEIVPNLFGANRRPTGERGFFARWRTATKVLVPNAFRYLEVK